MTSEQESSTQAATEHLKKPSQAKKPRNPKGKGKESRRDSDSDTLSEDIPLKKRMETRANGGKKRARNSAESSEDSENDDRLARVFVR